ncbi:MAG: DUF3298 domain-containing protein [Prevotella sp.]|nr:DUF3298 domain-containing protein [Prevotella sp.]
MKKSLLLAICVMAVVISCKPGTGQSEVGSASGDSTKVNTTVAGANADAGIDSLKTDTVSYDKEEDIFKLGLSAEYPVAGGDSVVKAVRAFINDFLGGAYDGPLADGKKMIKRNGEHMWGIFMERCGDADTEDANELFLYMTVGKVYETKSFVSFLASTSQYTGGLHGIGFDEGHTFSKVTGESFGYDMMKDTDTPAFKRLIKEGLRKYFSNEEEKKVLSDEELLEELVGFDGSIDELPLPDSEPYISEKGVTFIYQPYEISYYAAGKPEFTIPLDAVKPYLKAQAIELFLSK